MKGQRFFAKEWIYDDTALPVPGSAQEVWFELRADDVELTSVHTGNTRSYNPEAAELVLCYQGKPIGFINFNADEDCISEIVRADGGDSAFFIKLYCFGWRNDGCLKYKAKGGSVRQYSHTEAKSMQGINRSVAEACRERDAQLDSSMESWERVRDGLAGFFSKTAKVGYTWVRAAAFFAEKSPVLEVVDSESSKVVLRFSRDDEATKGTLMSITESCTEEPSKMILRFKICGERDRGAFKPTRRLEDIEYTRALG